MTPARDLTDADEPNFHALLRKYMDHVAAWEGQDFLDNRYRNQMPEGEWRVLQLATMDDADLLREWSQIEYTDTGTDPRQNELAAEIARRELDV